MSNKGSEGMLHQSSQIRNNGILSFITQKNSFKRPEGKKCNPYRQFGISSEAPSEFRLKNTLINSRIDNKNDTNKKAARLKNDFGRQQKPKQQNRNFHKTNFKDLRSFARSHSQLTHFYDRNVWMGKKIFASERSNSVNNLQVLNKINILKKNKLNVCEEKTTKMYGSTSSLSLSKVMTHEDMCQYLKNYKMKNSGSIFGSNAEISNLRPLTSDSAFQKNIQGGSCMSKKSKQFEIKTLEWGHRDFDMKYLSWNPEGRQKQV